MNAITPKPAPQQLDLPALLDRQRQAFMREGVVRYETRVDRIDRCLALLVDHQTAICDAVNRDFGCRSRHVTLMSDLFTSVHTLKHVKKNIKKWMKVEKRRAPVPLGLFGAKAHIQYQPKGVIGIMTPWNVPVNMIFSPLADALGAGNRVMIKPSEYTPNTSALMAELFAQYFDPTEICVVTGEAEVGAAFSALPFDHLIFTGATSVGKLVMRAASANLTPVTLELGGKSPVIVSRSADIDEVVDKLIAGKTMNSGQLCISPDYVFVPDNKLEMFIHRCRERFTEFFPTILNNPDYVSVINQRHFERISGYIEDARQHGARVEAFNPASENWQQGELRKIPLHLIIEPAEQCQVMQDEIFGPLMIVKTYRELDSVIDYINRRPRPLALYYFGKDKAEQEHVLNHTTSGGVTINDVAMHVACDDLPFGGNGYSGMGNYHGIEGFRTFSHARGTFKQGFLNLAKLAGTLPPFTDKVDKMMAGQITK